MINDILKAIPPLLRFEKKSMRSLIFLFTCLFIINALACSISRSAYADIITLGRNSVLSDAMSAITEDAFEGQRAGFAEVFFVTNRLIDRGAITKQRENHENFKYEAVFRNMLAQEASYGIVRVTYPLKRKVGEDNFSSRSGDENPYNVFTFFDYRVVAGPERLAAAAKLAYPRTFGEKSLLYIHGMDNSFPEAVQRLTQLTVDMKSSFVPIVFSWPSDSERSIPDRALYFPQPKDYWNVLNNATNSTRHAKSAIYTASSLGNVHILAHSMGAHVSTEAIIGHNNLLKMDNGLKQGRTISAIALAAPDIGLEQFKINKLPILSNLSSRITVYCADDIALRFSELINGTLRLGRCTDELPMLAGVQTVKVSGKFVDFLRHSYFLNSKLVIENLENQLFGSLRPVHSNVGSAPKPLLIETDR